MDTQYRKNLKAVLTASKDYTDNSIEKLKWELGTYDLSVTTDSTVAYTKTIPTNTIKGRLNYIGGASKVMVNDFDSNLTSISPETNVSYTKVGNSYVIVNSTNNQSRVVFNTTLNGKHTIAFDSDTSISYGFRINSLSLQNNIVVGKNIFEDIAFTGNNPISIYIPANSTVTISNIVSTTNYFENIRSAKTTSVKFEGQNLFDNANTTLNKELLADGTISDNSNYFYSDYIEVDNNSTYNYNLGVAFNTCFYDSNKTFISGYPYSTTFTTPNNAKYIRMSATKARLDTLMICKGTTIPTTYQPYIAPITKQIPSEIQALEGYGIGIDDTTYNYVDLINKKFVQDCKKIVVDSSTNYSYISSTFSQATISTQVPYKAPTTAFSKIWVNNDNINEITQETNGGLLVKFINNYSSQQELRQAMLGVEIVYELATPVETDISQYIDDDFKNIDTTYMGTITFENEFEYDVPSEIDYLIEEVKA